MLTRNIGSLLAILTIATFVGPEASAQPPNSAPASAYPGMGASSTFFSPCFKANFSLVVHQIPTFPAPFYCMRVDSDPQPGSPLIAAGIGRGDYIVRLDGTHVTSPAELDNHIQWTSIRFIRNFGAAPETAQVWVNNPRFPQYWNTPQVPTYPQPPYPGGYPGTYPWAPLAPAPSQVTAPAPAR